MAMMSVTASQSASHGFHAFRPARPVGWTVSRARAGNPIPSRHLVWVADVTMRFALALVPFSTLAWMFIAR